MSMLPTIDEISLSAQLFDQLHAMSFDGEGITRDAFGEGEQKAHELLQSTAEKLGLEYTTDHAMNLFITLPGRDRSAPRVIVGSHMDTVPSGGNFDGAAGVIAGLEVLSAWKQAGIVPECDLVVMAVRAEESAWFPISYTGSKSSLGLLTPEDMATPRRDDGIPLAEHIRQCGGDPDKVISSPLLKVEDIRAFIEVHIEQGPVLEEAQIPVAVVSGICGSLRYRFANTYGDYAHSGATPRNHRHDAVLATAELVTTLHQKWVEMEHDGKELTYTTGRFFTDPVKADMSKVGGEVGFCIDFRSRFPEHLKEMGAFLDDTIATLTKKHGVRFELGDQSSSTPAQLDEGLRVQLSTAARKLDIECHEMPSGAGHDCALFASQGVPGAMLFVRNQNGSHNAHEAMQLDDFKAAIQVLNQALLDMLA